jgi:hypothetical protein
VLPLTPANCYHPAFPTAKLGLFPDDVPLRKEALLVMQSSAAVAARALIMLACVVGIPALALSGTSWSEMLKRIQGLRLPAILTPAAASTSPSLSEAPRLVSAPAAPTATARSAAGLPEVTPARGPSQALFAKSPWPGQALEAANTGVVPVGYQAPLDSQPGGLSPSSFAAESASGAAGLGGDRFRSVQDRLQALGATYYLLESWGNQQQMYRFYCRMAVGGNPNYTHYFEAIESDPLQAMGRVLRQVETWRLGGPVATSSRQ